MDFDCALATAYMYLAAQSLGLGARIYTGFLDRIDAEIRETRGIEVGYRPVAVLRIGRIKKDIDVVSFPSPRKPRYQVVNYVE